MKNYFLLSVIFGLTMVLGLAAVPHAEAAVDMFLKIEGVDGESQDSKHKDEIDVLSWSWGVSNSGTTHIGGGGGAAKANFDDLTFTKNIDKSSPVILLHAANGDHFSKADLTLRKAGAKTPVEFLVITLDNVLVSSYSTGGSSDDIPTENISLNFAKVTVKYTETQPDGSPGPSNDFKWNIADNSGF